VENTDRTPTNLVDIFQRLFDHYGPQSWWPAEHEFEVMVGAVLTQNTNWKNVELALENLRKHNVLDFHEILKLEIGDLETLIRPAGFYRKKANTIRSICSCLVDHQGIEGLSRQSHEYCRKAILDITGIGDETADAILLYALDKPAFVIDKYTNRIVSRLNSTDSSLGAQDLQQAFMQQLPPQLACYQEYHALLVEHAKVHCRKKPVCIACPLQSQCEHFINPGVN